MFRYLILLACSVLLLTACGGSSKSLPTVKSGESASDAALRQVGFIGKKQFGPEWDELIPAQQSLVPRALYISCASQANIPDIKSMAVVGTYDEPIDVPGTSLHYPSTAVTVKLSLSQGIATSDTTQTFHEIMMDGKWRWIVKSTDNYAAGKCP